MMAARKKAAVPAPPKTTLPPINVADLEAVAQILDVVLNMTDSLDAEQCLAFRPILSTIKSKAGDALSLMETQAIKTLEGQPRQIGGSVFTTKNKGKWRPNHQRIKTRIITLALHDDESGEVLEADAAAARAVDITYTLFVAPSQEPKQAGMKELHLEKKDVCDWEVTGKELIEVLVDGRPE